MLLTEESAGTETSIRVESSSWESLWRRVLGIKAWDSRLGAKITEADGRGKDGDVLLDDPAYPVDDIFVAVTFICVSPINS